MMRVSGALLLLAAFAGHATCGKSGEDRAAACGKVASSLEAVRANIGGWCGTPDVTAHFDIMALGPIAVPCLREALADRDYEVAYFAAQALRDLSAEDALREWCGANPKHRNAGVCTNQPPPKRPDDLAH